MSDIVWEGSAPKDSNVVWEREGEGNIVWETQQTKSKPKQVGNVGKDAIFHDKASLVAEAAFAANKYTGRNDGRTAALQAKRLRDSFTRNPYLKTPEREAQAVALEEKAKHQLASYLTLRKSYNTDLQEADPSFAEQLVGSLGPSMIDELNLVPISRGRNIIMSGVKGAAAGLPLGIISAWEQGQYDKAIGLMKKDPDLKQLMEAGVDTALIVAAMNMLTHGKGPGPKPADLDAKAKAEAFVKDLGPVNPEQGIDKSKARSPYEMPPLTKDEDMLPPDASFELPPDAERLKRQSTLTPTNVKASNIYNEMAAKTGREQIPGQSELNLKANEAELNKPYWPDQELQDAIAQANRAAVARENFKISNDQNLEASILRGDDPTATLMRDPLASRSVDEAKADMEIAKIDSQQPTNPYMSPEELARSQELTDKYKSTRAGHSEMEIPEEAGNVPYWADADLEKAKVTAARTAESRKGGPVDIARDGGGMDTAGEQPLRSQSSSITNAQRVQDLKTNAAFANKLTKSKNAVDALKVVLEFVKDTDLRKIANSIFKYVNKDTQFHVMNPEDVATTKLDSAFRKLDEDALGLHITNEEGNQGIALRGSGYMLDKKLSDGMSVEAALHEIKHSVTDRAFYVAQDPQLSKLPKYKAQVKYVDDITRLMREVSTKVSPENLDKFRAAFENPAEFNTYGWTSPEFREVLKEVRVADKDKTGLAKFFEAIKAFFGHGSSNASKALDSFLNRLDEIQGVDKADVGAAVKRLIEKNESAVSKMSDQVDKDNSKKLTSIFDSFKDLKQYIPMTFNQKVEFLKSPPLINAYNLLRSFYNKADVRFNLYQIYLQDVKKFMETDKDGAIKMFKVLADIQDPNLFDARKLAETTDTRDQFLAQQGMNPEHIPHAIKVLDVLRHIGKFDQDIAYKNLGHNWHQQPMYFPREHTGQYTVSVIITDGTLKSMAGFDSSVEAHKYKEAYQQALQEAGHIDLTVTLDQHKINSLGDVYAMMALQNTLPDFLKKINDTLLKEIEVAKRKFEMERSSEKIAGYTGESITTKNEQDRLFSLLQRRMEQSFSLEVKSNTIKHIKEGILENADLMKDQPDHIKELLHYFIAREIGLDVSLLAPAGKKVDQFVHTIGKQIDRFAGSLHGYKGGDVSIFSPDVIRQLVQSYTWSISLWKLALSPATLTANATTLAMTPFDGYRRAFKEGKNPLFAHLALQKAIMHKFDQGSKDFLHQAALEGMVTPRMSDPLTLIPTHETNKIDRVVNKPRDYLEAKTNEVGLIYYYQYYTLTRPDLNPLSDKFKALVYSAVRDWTGDYTHAAQVMGISQLGAVGQLNSNFAKWKYNQIGRLMNDLQDAAGGNFGPLMVTSAIALSLAGLAGAPFFVEYESVRRNLQKLGFDLKPLNSVLYEGKDWAKENYGENAEILADMLIKGPLAVGSRELGEMFDVTAPDLSNNLRYSALLDASTLPIQFAADLYKGASAGVKELMRLIGLGYGASDQEIKDAMKALPTVASNAIEQHLNERYGGDVAQYSTQDKGETRLTEQEKVLNALGMRSMRHNEQKDRTYAKDWVERYEKKQIGKLTNQLIAAVRKDPEIVDDIVKDIYDLKGQVGVDRAIEDITKRYQDRAMDYFEREVVEASGQNDPVALSKALEALRKFKPAK